MFSKQRHGGLFFRIFVELGGLAGKHFRMKLDWDEVVIIVKREDWERLPARFKEARTLTPLGKRGGRRASFVTSFPIPELKSSWICLDPAECPFSNGSRYFPTPFGCPGKF